MPPQKIYSQRLGIFLTLIAALGFAGKTILAKMAYAYGVDALTLLAARMCVAGSIFLLILIFNISMGRWKLIFTKRQWILIFILGFFGYYLSSFLDFSGLVYIDANLGRMILFLYPTMVVIISAFLDKQKIPGRVRICLGICYIGLLMMMLPNLHGGQNSFLKGCFLIFMAAVAYAFYLVGVDRHFKGNHMGLLISVTMCVSCLSVLIHFFLTHSLEALWVPKTVYLLTIIMGLFSTVLPIYALSAGIAIIGASKAASLNMTGPIMTLAMGAILLGEKISLIQLVGMALIISGVWRMR
jgi:drug/metabolite transporter (DMT)-like permease